MRRSVAIGLASVLACSSLPALADAPCPVPDDLILRDLVLPAAKKAVSATHRLVILTLGGAHTAGLAVGEPEATYPARLQTALTVALPGVAVTVINDAKPKSTVDTVAPEIPGIIAKDGASLVIWAPGGRDAMLRPNFSGFFTELQGGIDAVRHGGADLILLDMQYVPSLEQWSRIADYRDMLRGTASAYDVPLVPRHELMRAWADDGTLNLDATDKNEQTQVTKKLFSCMAQVLAAPIAEAVR